MIRILVTRMLPETVLDALRALGEVTVRSGTAPLTVDQAAEALGDYDVILPTLGDAFRAAAFDAVPEPHTRLLANFGVGYNHIDAVAAGRAGVAVTNTPGAVTDATADIAMTLILMTCRRAGEGERLVRAGRWTGWQPTQLLGFHITGKTVGIVGMGRIGKAIAARCHHGFGMEVVFFNRSTVDEPGMPARQLPSVAEVMRAADIVVLAVPGSAETHHLIGAGELAAMKPTGYLVNIARGDVVDEAVLVTALKEGSIAGAGLDVYEREPEVSPGLLEMENVTLLPHLGTSALEVRVAMGMVAVANIAAFVEGRDLPNRVNGAA